MTTTNEKPVTTEERNAAAVRAWKAADAKPLSDEDVRLIRARAPGMLWFEGNTLIIVDEQRRETRRVTQADWLATLDERTRERDEARAAELARRASVEHREQWLDEARREGARAREEVAAALKREEGLRLEVEAVRSVARVAGRSDGWPGVDDGEGPVAYIHWLRARVANVDKVAIKRVRDAAREAAARKEAEGRLVVLAAAGASVLESVDLILRHLKAGTLAGDVVRGYLFRAEEHLRSALAAPRHPQESARWCCPACGNRRTRADASEPCCPHCGSDGSDPAPPTPEVDPDTDPTQWGPRDVVATHGSEMTVLEQRDGEVAVYDPEYPDEGHMCIGHDAVGWRRISRAATPEVDRG